jgi:hypothetical protein
LHDLPTFRDAYRRTPLHRKEKLRAALEKAQPGAEQESSCDERDWANPDAVAWSRRGADAQIDHHLDLVTAIFARPEMTNLALAHVLRPPRRNH